MRLHSIFNPCSRRWGRLLNLRPDRFTPEERAKLPIVQEVAWLSRPVWKGAEILTTTGIRIPKHRARSKSPYRLRYAGPK